MIIVLIVKFHRRFKAVLDHEFATTSMHANADGLNSRFSWFSMFRQILASQTSSTDKCDELLRCCYYFVSWSNCEMVQFGGPVRHNDRSSISQML